MRDKSIATAAAAAIAAFAVAHLMQFGLTAGRALSDDVRAAPVGLVSYLAAGPQLTASVPAMPGMPDDEPGPPILAGARGGGGPLHLWSARATGASAGMADISRLSCTRSLRAEPVPGGLLRLRLDACQPEARVEIRHGAIRFAISTGERGTEEVVLPALAVEAEVLARFADGSTASARASVPEAAEAEWLGVVWEGGHGVALRVDEGPPRHLLGDPDAAAPVLAEVHGPLSGRLGTAPRLVVEVNSWTCGRDVMAEVHWSDPQGAPERVPARIAMPDCGAPGEIVELPLDLPAVRVAHR